MSKDRVDVRPSEETVIGQHLTVEHAAQLFRLSYRFSQGDPDLQLAIFNYLHQIKPEWSMDDISRRELAKSVHKTTLNFLAPSIDVAEGVGETAIHSIYDTSRHLLDKPGAHGDVYIQTKNIQSALNHVGIAGSPILSIAKKVAERDYHFLVETEGRPRYHIPSGAEQSPIVDPWLSHFYFYGFEGNVEGHKTGLPEYDLMFQLITHFAKNVQDMSLADRVREKLEPVKAVYYKKSPNAIRTPYL